MSTLRDAMSHAALGWVKPELDETLRQARSEIEYFVEDPADASRMRFCAGYLHQVQGTLRMVELYAPAMVAEELELLADAVRDGAVPDRDEACATLMRGTVLLPDYLERLQNGHRDIPIVLLPLLNEIRAARAAEGINEGVLLAFDPEAGKASEAELEHARGSLQGRNRELLDTVGNAVKEELLRIKDALDLHVRMGGATADLQTQVNELGAVSDTLGVMGLGVARGVVAQQRDALREVVDGSRPIDDNLLLDIAGALLYVDASLDDQVAYLGAALEGDEDPAAVETRRTVEVLAHEAIANFAAAREAFVAFIETNWDHARLQDVPRLLDEVSGALRMLDLRVPADYMNGIRQYIGVELIGRRRIPGGRQLDTLADAMASLEYYLEALRERRPGREEILDITRSSLEALRYWPVPVAGRQEDAAPAFVMDAAGETPVPASPVAAAPAPFEAPQAPVGTPTPLVFGDAIHAPPPSAAPAAAAEPPALPAWNAADGFGAFDPVAAEGVPATAEAGLSVAPLDLSADSGLALEPFAAEATGDTHATDAGAPAFLSVGAGDTAPEESIAPLSFDAASFESTGDEPAAKAVAAPAAADGGSEAAAPDHEIAAFLAELDRAAAAFDPLTVETDAPAAPVVDAPAALPAMQAGEGVDGGFDNDAEQIDQDIRDVFIEEFDEELQNLGRLLPAWRAAPESMERLRPVRRVFHTLKGSGRLVGARTLGEFSWKIESMLNRVLDGSRPASPAVVALVSQAYDVLPQFNAALRGNGRIHADVAGMQDIADRVAAGEEAFHVAAAPAAAPAAATPPATATAAAPAPAATGGTPASVDSVLREILEAEVGQHLATVEAWLSQSQPQPQPVSEQLLRAVHTMSGAFAMTEVPEITAVTAPVESFVKRSLANAVVPSADGVAALGEAATAVAATITALQAPSPLIPSFAPLAARLRELADALPEAQWPPQVHDDFDDPADAMPVASTPVAAAEPEPLPVAEELASISDLSAYFDPALLEASFADAPTHDASVPQDAPATAVDETVALQVFEWLEDDAGAGEADAATAAATGTASGFSGAPQDEAATGAAQDGTLDDAVISLQLDDVEQEIQTSADFVSEPVLDATSIVFEPIEPIEPMQAMPPAGEMDSDATDAGVAPVEPATDAAATPQDEARHDDSVAGSDAAAAAPIEIEQEMAAMPTPSLDAVEPVEPPTGQGEAAADAVPAETALEAGIETEAAGEAEAEPEPEAEAEAQAEAEAEAGADAALELAPLTPPVQEGESPAVAAEAAAFDAGPLDFDDLDRELVDIFVEEGKDLLDHCDRLISELRSAPEDRELLAGLQRDLHTLKGGARMAGINAIGDLGHGIESLLEAVAASRTEIGRGDVQLLERGFDRLHQLLIRTGAHRAVQMPADLIEAFEARTAGGEAPEATASADAVPPSLAAVASTAVDVPQAAPEAQWQAASTAADPAPPSPVDAAGDGASDSQAVAEVEAVTEVEIEVGADADADAVAVPATATATAPVVESRPLPAAAIASEPLSPPVVEAQAVDEEGSTRTQEQVRVRADLLDRLVNHAGEVAIYRSRLEQQLGAFRSAMGELDRTNARLRDQLRRLDLETEAQIVARYRREQEQADQAFDPLELDRFSTLQQLSRALNESAADLGGLQGVLDDLSRNYDALLQQQSRVSSELQDGLMRARMVPFDGLVPRLRRVVRQAAQDIGKQVHLNLEGTHGELDRNVLDRMVAPLEHMLRNSVAHGLETPEQRLAAGKPEEGAITLRLRREGSEIVLEVADDGAGLDREAIRRRGEQRGLIQPGEQVEDARLDNLIFASGFSTSEQVSQLAGRGVGMDVVRNEVRQLGGSVDIHSVRGEGVTFTLRLPQTLAVTQAVFVRIGETTFAVPVASVSGIGRIARERFESGQGGYHYNGEDFALHDLGTLVGQAAAKAEGQPQIPLLLVRAGDLRAAVAIDQVLGNREIVVKPVGLQIASVPGIYGATITGEGNVVVILDVAPLVRRHLSQPQQPVEVATVGQQRHVPLVMVVDDSLTMRKVTGRVLERHNFEVVAARDGIEALERLEERVPDLMLLDIEMPRMDGYELATAMRADPRYKEVPIVMITSRSGDKHRQRAFEIGVQRYLGKPYQELDLMRNVYDLLGIARVRE
ncbi:response regulator [Stenotrophomonas acidaminiphila]|uniref:Hpt domain-containing protein n=1 Tax=Stenotrophomonas acidaminiphila TaxID=128780 RepID=UPI002404C247|nr:Hpt domain-containing protein [Stenotrophomonas acidaminiphila]MDF9441060.1 response regulator [Stenotrophomonas acidaminiphila]